MILVVMMVTVFRDNKKRRWRQCLLSMIVMSTDGDDYDNKDGVTPVAPELRCRLGSRTTAAA